MPKRTDLRKVMLIGSGPIQIGQAAEFDFSGSQACKALKEEGFEVVLVNSNPATIQTDVGMADAVYLEPLTVENVEAIIAKERPQGILSGMGGQTGLNLCSDLAAAGVLARYGVELLGTQLAAIEDSEDRELFKKMMEAIGEPVPRAGVAHSHEEARRVIAELGLPYPVLIRPAYTLGGTGGGIAYSEEELGAIVGRGLVYSRIKQVLVEESVLGWGEFEYEVMRDADDNCITVCNMENLDAMGIHTGESIVVAPAQTLSDRDHQMLRSAAIKIIRALRIEGGCNVQFALHHDTGAYRVIEVNPRVSRSSALASKATGYPIARVAAKIAVGMRLWEIDNKITGKTRAAFEPTLDYVVTKVPRWPFDKFRTIDRHIGTQMKSTGEVMAIGRNIEESLQKAIRSLEVDAVGFAAPEAWSDAQVEDILAHPTHERIFAIVEALRRGWGTEKVRKLTDFDPFFLAKLSNVLALEGEIRQAAEPGAEPGATRAGIAGGAAAGSGGPVAAMAAGGSGAVARLPADLLRRAKRAGFADERIAELVGATELEVRARRRELGLRPVYGMVDTCAAEFAAVTPYYYSTYEDAAYGEEAGTGAAAATGGGGREERAGGSRGPGAPRKKVLILGSGPIRIGQGIEFDYCCVHAAWAAREAGFETVLVNNNPETVSTDFDTSDRLYFEPLTLENVMDVIEEERPEGVLVQFGGQTAINLALPLQAALAARPDLPTRIWGTSPDAIDLAEDRAKFNALMQELKIPQPDGGTGFSFEETKVVADRVGYPVLVRPSYVLGGRAMVVVSNAVELESYMKDAVKVSKKHPILVDKFIGNAIEVDVDAVCDGEEVLIGAIMEHIEEAGVHSGDSTCTIPPPTLPHTVQRTIELYTRRVALALGTRGLINIQYAVKEEKVYILEANPRSSRTVPYVAKATGIPLANVAARVALGARLRDLKLPRQAVRHWAVKAPVFPFQKLVGLDSILGPEMKSTGEVMGIDEDLGRAFWKAMEASGNRLPADGTVFVSVREEDREKILPIVSELVDLGYAIVATRGTAQYLRDFGLAVETVWKVYEKGNPDALDLMRKGVVRLIINTPSGKYEAPERRDGFMMRRLAVELQIPFIATLAAAKAVVQALRAIREGKVVTRSLREYHAA